MRLKCLSVTVGLCILSDVLLIGLGVLGLAQLGGLSTTLKNTWSVRASCFCWSTARRPLTAFVPAP